MSRTDVRGCSTPCPGSGNPGLEPRPCGRIWRSGRQVRSGETRVKQFIFTEGECPQNKQTSHSAESACGKLDVCNSSTHRTKRDTIGSAATGKSPGSSGRAWPQNARSPQVGCGGGRGREIARRRASAVHEGSSNE